jgi:hypothetical protein
MTDLRKLVACAMLGGMFTGAALAQDAENVPGWLEKDFADFAERLEGRWDNDRHVFFAEDAGMDPDGIAPRQHTTFRASDMTDDETGHALQSVTDMPTGEQLKLHHVLSLDADAKAIVQTVSHPDLPECRIAWARTGSQFEGAAAGAGCEAMFGAGTLSMTLSDQEFWISRDTGDGVVELRMRRARPFECWTAILRGASHGDSGAGMDDWWFRRGVKLHDQGGVAELVTDETPPRKVRLKLRDVDWPYGTNRPSLTLYVMEGESDRAVSYAWGEAGAKRLGLNLRWLQASCSYAPESRED